jgi:hypothetical protein
MKGKLIMTRSLKALSSALLVMVALGAAIASPASAHLFRTEQFPTVLTGEQVGAENIFTFEGTGVKAVCKIVTVAGTVPVTSVQTITVHPTYKECSVAGISMTVNTSECDYILYGETVKDNETEHGPVEIECNKGGGNFKFSFLGCVVQFPPQKPTYGMRYVNEGVGATRDVKVTVTSEKTKYTTNNAAACNLAGIPPEGEDGTMKGTVTVKGYKDLSEGPPAAHQDEFKEGTQVGIWLE